jgi:hypothetical protein
MSDIEKLCKEAATRFRGMSPEAQKKMRDAQRKSWVIGEIMIEHPDMTRAQAERLWNRLELGLGADEQKVREP